jgi:NAD(P)-dependent dehydrogenase (short-subunit alcohol dehydrogenase family)
MSAKRALVTGASHGLGAHLAARLAEDGWEVTGLGRRPESALPADRGFDYIQADLSVPDTVESLACRIGEVPDLVVHNAVTYPDRGERVPKLSDLESVFRVNALAPYRLTLDLLAAKPEDRFCSCVVVNSEAMYHADRWSAGYAASKAALRVLTTALADSCRSRNAAVSTLLLGPLADPKKIEDIRAIAEKRGMTENEVTRLFLRKSNPDLVIDTFIDHEACYCSLRYLADLGPIANGSVCRLDGGSSGSLV